jgi:hypothetical protein
MSPPVDPNENAHPAKVSGFEKLTRRLTSFQHNYYQWLCKRILASEFSLRTGSSTHYAVSSLELPANWNQLLQFASNQNCLTNLARHFRMSQSSARQIGESESILARQIGYSRSSLSETLRRVSYLLSTAQPQSAGTSGSALPS